MDLLSSILDPIKAWFKAFPEQVCISYSLLCNKSLKKPIPENMSKNFILKIVFEDTEVKVT